MGLFDKLFGKKNLDEESAAIIRMAKEYTIIPDNKVLTINNQQITFNDNIETILIFPDRHIIFLKNTRFNKEGQSCVRMSEQPSNNIFCIDNDCNILWDTQKLNRILYDDSVPSNDTYVGIKKVSENILRVWTWSCFFYDIDIDTFKIVNKQFTK
jgi:hypothetical protein